MIRFYLTFSPLQSVNNFKQFNYLTTKKGENINAKSVATLLVYSKRPELSYRQRGRLPNSEMVNVA